MDTLVLSVLLSLAFVASTNAAGPDDPAPARSFAPDGSVLLNDQAAPSPDPALAAQPAQLPARAITLTADTLRSTRPTTTVSAVRNTLADSVVSGKPIVRTGTAAAGQQPAVSGLRSLLWSMPCYPVVADVAAVCPDRRERILAGHAREDTASRARLPSSPCDCGCDSASPAVIGSGEAAPQERRSDTRTHPGRTGRSAPEPAPTPVTPDESLQPTPPAASEAPDATAVEERLLTPQLAARACKSMSRISDQQVTFLTCPGRIGEYASGVVGEGLLRASSQRGLARFRFVRPDRVPRKVKIGLSGRRVTADTTCTRDREGGITIRSSRFRIEVMV